MSQSDNPVAVRIYLVIHPILYALLLCIIGAVTSLLSALIYLSTFPSAVLGAFDVWAWMLLSGLFFSAQSGLVLGLGTGLGIGLTASIFSWANAGWKRLLAWTTLIGIGITVAASVVGGLLFMFSFTS